MSLHKLQTERDRDGTAISVSLNTDLYDLAGAIVNARAVRACDFALRSLPVYRLVRWSAHRTLVELFDALALDAAFSAQRIGEGTALLSAPGLFIAAAGSDKGGYCSCMFRIWADTPARAAEADARLRAIAGSLRVRDQTFVIDWHFTAGNGDLRSASFEEVANDLLLDEAYPSLGAPVQEFISGYLAAPEAVLVLLGPPGGGKTRLVREILAALSRRKGKNAEVMYTTDKRALAGDEMFVEFITGSHDAFVVEDTDHLLKSRTSGNEEMHRFLAIADGISRAQGRKIVFTTNLPNITDIDAALVRPGRCHAVKDLRGLTPEEALRLAARIGGADAGRVQRASAGLVALASKSYSVAQVYRACA